MQFFFIDLRSEIFEYNLERWPSGRRRTPGKCVTAKSGSWVRIPFSPPSLAEVPRNRDFGELFSATKRFLSDGLASSSVRHSHELSGRSSKADAVRNIPEIHYVNILRLSNNKYYVGCTIDLVERLARHQNGYVDSTKHHIPVELVFYSAFFDKYKAFEFEKYLKSGSGRAFTLKHLV